MTKEQAYDEKIFPLMSQIIEVCQEHKIPMLASFTLDRSGDGLQCTTALLEEGYEPADNLLAAYRALFRQQSPLMVTTRDGDGKVTNMTAIL